MRLRHAGAFFFHDKIGIRRSVLKSGIDFCEALLTAMLFYRARGLTFQQR